MNKALMHASTLLPLAVAAAASFAPGIKSSTAKSSGSHAKAVACFSSLSSCPEVGCASDTKPEGQTNIHKRHRITGGTPIVVTISDLVTLQPEAEKRVGTGKTPLSDADRSKLEKLKVHGLTVGDGDFVAVPGFVADDPAVHANTGESVNCSLKNSANNDFHITLVEEAGATGFEGIVVEMIPQDRPAQWTTKALKRLAAAETQVLVVGQLFYDSQHDVNDDSSHPTRDPERASLFEVHPITRFLVCTQAKPCNPKVESEWTPLEEVKAP
jgi:hypothetical protein